MHTVGKEGVTCCDDGVIDGDRSLRSSGDKQGGTVGVQSQIGASAGTTPGSIRVAGVCQVSDLRAQRHTDEGALRQRGVGERRTDENRKPRGDLVRQPGNSVLLVNDDGDPGFPGSQVCRQRDVTAEADDHISPALLEHRTCLPYRSGQPTRNLEQIRVHRARQRHRRNHVELETGLGDHSSLKTLRRPDAGDRDATLLQSLRGGNKGRCVASRSSASQNNVHHGYSSGEWDMASRSATITSVDDTRHTGGLSASGSLSTAPSVWLGTGTRQDDADRQQHRHQGRSTDRDERKRHADDRQQIQ